MSKEFVREITVRLDDTDSAGLLFFANQFRLVHAVYEDWLSSVGLSLATLLAQGELLLPIIHSEAEFLAPLAVGDQLSVALQCTARSPHSFTLSFEIKRQDRLVGRVSTVHVLLDRRTNQKIEAPRLLDDSLSAISREW